MDGQQQQRMNRAAQEFTDALLAAYRTTSENTAAVQELSAQQLEYFFNTVINNLRTQAEGTLHIRSSWPVSSSLHNRPHGTSRR
jgi:hypothetical protein